MLNRLPVLLLVILAFGVVAEGQRTGRPTELEMWRAKVDESSRLLVAGDHAASLRISERVIREMVDHLGPGEPATRAFGLVLSHKALALAGLGREDEALWWWHSVLALYPAFAKSDLSSFGAAGAFLDRHREPRQETKPGQPSKDKSPAIKPPKLLKRVTPEFPSGAHYFGVSGLLIVEVRIDTKGKVMAPRILQALPAPTLSYVALDALRKWRFEPALVDGKPAEVIFNLTVNYKQ